jgi:hypothetical protein
MALYHVTLKDSTRGPRRRTVLSGTFDLNDPERRTLKLNLSDAVKAELEATGDYTFRPAAAETNGKSLTKRGGKQGAAPIPDPAAEPAAPDPGPVPTEEK